MRVKPIGITPKFIHDEHRMLDILQGMYRYTKDGQRIPQEWIDELSDLMFNYNNKIDSRNIISEALRGNII